MCSNTYKLIKHYELESRIENEANNSVMEGNTQDEQENGLASPYYKMSTMHGGQERMEDRLSAGVGV